MKAPVWSSSYLMCLFYETLCLTDSKGYLLDEDGFDYVKISLLRDIKVQQRSLRCYLVNPTVYLIIVLLQYVASIFMYMLLDRDYVKSNPRAKYFEDAKPWSEQCDIAFPCASQNEIDQPDAIALVNSGCRLLIEGV